VALKIYSVSEITEKVKVLLESEFYSIWIQGEISNFSKHHSGHFYFSLKDRDAQLQCVMWRNKNIRLSFNLEDGLKIQAYGRITVYAKSGRYQLEVDEIQPLGIGELQLAFEQLKKKLEKEGLFDKSFKKPLPQYPFKIGIVTSPTGAAIKDFISVLKRRFPAVEIILNPAKVQGKGAAEDIVRAIKEFNEWGNIDLLLVGRGGGSLEDLWAFNEEIVAYAIFDSKIPVISAVGHEIDFSISDFVADMRAPTPSAAAEMAVIDFRELDIALVERIRKLYRNVSTTCDNKLEKIRSIETNYYFRKPQDLIKQYDQTIDEAFTRMERSYTYYLETQSHLLSQMEKRLDSLNPEKVLKRGYSICYKIPESVVIKKSNDVKQSDRLKIKLYKGEIETSVERIIH